MTSPLALPSGRRLMGVAALYNLAAPAMFFASVKLVGDLTPLDYGRHDRPRLPGAIGSVIIVSWLGGYVLTSILEVLGFVLRSGGLFAAGFFFRLPMLIVAFILSAEYFQLFGTHFELGAFILALLAVLNFVSPIAVCYFVAIKHN